jgi:chaperone required for assembly of F1-ATPase
MSAWAPKRFWNNATVEPEAEGFAVRLDGRPVRTPSKRLLIVPTLAIAERIADEWRAQGERVDPRTMPWTRSANSALDKVSVQRVAVMDHLSTYAGTDLLCYRAEVPEGLVARQAQTWDPILEWAAERYGARLRTTIGVMPILQDQAALDRLGETMLPMSDFQLTGFHDMVALSGSFTIGLAASQAAFPPLDLWSASRVDEDWQIEQWGEDDQATKDAAAKCSAFLHATELFHAA